MFQMKTNENWQSAKLKIKKITRSIYAKSHCQISGLTLNFFLTDTGPLPSSIPEDLGLVCHAECTSNVCSRQGGIETFRLERKRMFFAYILAGKKECKKLCFKNFLLIYKRKKNNSKNFAWKYFPLPCQCKRKKKYLKFFALFIFRLYIREKFSTQKASFCVIFFLLIYKQKFFDAKFFALFFFRLYIGEKVST